MTAGFFSRISRGPLFEIIAACTMFTTRYVIIVLSQGTGELVSRICELLRGYFRLSTMQNIKTENQSFSDKKDPNFFSVSWSERLVVVKLGSTLRFYQNSNLYKTCSGPTTCQSFSDNVCPYTGSCFHFGPDIFAKSAFIRNVDLMKISVGILSHFPAGSLEAAALNQLREVISAGNVSCSDFNSIISFFRLRNSFGF